MADLSSMRKALFIAYHFPPCGGVASVRSTEFVQRLPQFGWLPVVLTVSEEAHEGFPIDRQRLADIPPDIPICRVPGRSANRKFRLLYRLRLGRLVPACFCPDHEVYEVPQMYSAACRLVAEHKCEVIYSTSGPRSSHIVGLLAKRRTRLPWVADFRDPWDDTNELPYATPVHRRLSHWLEERVVRCADALVMNTPARAACVERGFGPDVRRKLYVIPNGYSDREFCPEVSTGVPVLRETTFVSVGTIYGRYVDRKGRVRPDGRFPLGFLRAIAQVADTRRELRSMMQFVLVGNFDSANERVLDDLGIRDVVRLVGVVSKQRSIDYMKRASVNVLLPGNDCPSDVVRARTYEVLRAGKPVLALARAGDTASLLERVGGAIIVEPENVGAIAEGICRLLEGIATGQLPLPDAALVRQFERGVLTKKLADVLEAITADGTVEEHECTAGPGGIEVQGREAQS